MRENNTESAEQPSESGVDVACLVRLARAVEAAKARYGEALKRAYPVGTKAKINYCGQRSTWIVVGFDKVHDGALRFRREGGKEETLCHVSFADFIPPNVESTREGRQKP